MALALSDLRTLARQFTRIGNDYGMYPDTFVDNALMLAAEDWVRVVKPSRTLSTLTLTAGANTMGSMPTAWKPEYQLKQTVVHATTTVNPDFHFADYNDVLMTQLNAGGTNAPTGVPKIFGFRDQSTGIFYPTADLTYTAYFWWWNPAPTWTAGGTASGLDVIPDEQWRIICSDGVTSKLQSKEPQSRVIAEEARQRFEAKMWQFKGRNAGGRGPQISVRDDPDVDYATERIIRA